MATQPPHRPILFVIVVVVLLIDDLLELVVAVRALSLAASSASSYPTLPFAVCASSADNNDATIRLHAVVMGHYREDPTTTASVSSIRAFAPPRTIDLTDDDD